MPALSPVEQSVGSAIVEYFSAEARLGWTLLGVGTGAVLVVVLLWGRRKDSPFAKGMLVPAVLIALGGAVGGPFLAMRSSRQIYEYTQQLQSDPSGLREAELARMERVNASWMPLKITWVCIMVGGAVVVWRKKGAWRGAALGFVGLAGALFVVDTTAEARARVYTSAIEKLPP